MEGIENVQVDTIHGVLGYKRKGADEKVQWAPPSALRRIDVILIDEASQYDNREWQRFAQSVAEQPHLPYVLAVANFQQLQPVSSGGLCQKMLAGWPCIELYTVYRTSDSNHLLFLNRIRERQPARQVNIAKEKQYIQKLEHKLYDLENVGGGGVFRGQALAPGIAGRRRASGLRSRGVNRTAVFGVDLHERGGG